MSAVCRFSDESNAFEASARDTQIHEPFLAYPDLDTDLVQHDPRSAASKQPA